MSTLTEANVEQITLSWLSTIRWQTAYGPDIAPNTPGAERADFTQVVLEERLRDALLNLNPDLPASALEGGLRCLINPDGPNLETRNRAFHRTLTNGVTVDVRGPDGTTTGVPAKVVDFEDPANNDWLAVNQFTVKEGQYTRRADIVLFVNGLPSGIIELKNPADENTDVWDAWQQLQTYKAQLPTLFSLNEFLMVSDGLYARIGPLTAGKEWFTSPGGPWTTMTPPPPNCRRCWRGSATTPTSWQWSGISSCSMTTENENPTGIPAVPRGGSHAEGRTDYLPYPGGERSPRPRPL